MTSMIGIILTIVCCIAALGTWGRTLQIIAIIALGLACIIADLKGKEC